MLGPSRAVIYTRNTTPDIVRVRGRYRVGKALGFGTFGSVYSGKDIKTEKLVALKLEVAQDSDSILAHEYSVYQAISGLPGIPKVYWYGREGPYRVIVLDRLGGTFEDIARTPIDTDAVFSYATQMLSVLESLHDRHYVHLDVKPDNFALGIGDLSHQVFLIDFGLAQLFRNPATRSPTVQNIGSKVIGTVRYSSINRHLGLAPSRRDDLESLVYVIVYLAKGSLPWQGIIVQPGQNHQDEVLKAKQGTTIKALCKDLPQPFVEFVEHIRRLGLRDKPGYKFLRSILEDCVLSHCTDTPKFTESCVTDHAQSGRHPRIGNWRCACPLITH